MAQILPLEPSIPNYRVSTVLDDVEYVLDLRWNARESGWYMDLRAADETLIRAGLKLVLGAVIGSTVTNLLFPDGVFLCRDLSNAGLDAAFDDLGVRVIVYYVPNSERDA